MSEVAEAPPSENGTEQPLTQEYVQKTIRSAVPDFVSPDKRTVGGDDAPEPVIDKPEKKSAKPPEEADNEIPLDDEPEQAAGEEEEEAPPEARGETDKAKSDAKWKMYREAYKESGKLKSELSTLRKQVAQLSDQSEVNTLREHVQALANERQRLVALVEQGNIEQSDMWQNEVMNPLNEMWEDIQTIAKRNSMDPQRVAALVQNGDDTALKDYMEEHSTRPGDQNYLYGMIREVTKVEKKKQYLKANAHELSQRSQQEMLLQRDNWMKGLTQARQQAVATIVPKVQEKILNVMPKNLRRDLQKDLKHIMDFENWEPDVQMYAGIAAVTLPDLLDSYNLLRGQLRDAKGELIKLRGGAPKITTGGRAPATVPVTEREPKDLAKISLTDFAEESTRRIRQGMGYRK
jgi:hypothetical protein